ncbi:MAG: hypothetical protein LC720_00260 [Actinobacteria bacterium]|nr:hypothetical protein [Actinomycetota bacterium]
MSSAGLGVGLLLSRSWAIYRAHLGMILQVAGGVVVVVDLILAAGLGQLTAGYDASSSSGGQVVSIAASAFVTTPLITAMLARAVLDVAAGEQPSVRRSVRCGLDLFAPLLIVMVLWAAAVFAGLLALFIPGIYIAVSWYFGAQAVVIDDRRGLAALARSGELVRGRWWRAAATGVVLQVAVLIPGSVVSVVFDEAARAANSTAILVLGGIVAQTFALPFVAIGATLFYLDLRSGPRPPPRRPAP